MVFGANYEDGFAGYIGNTQSLVDVLQQVGAGDLALDANTGGFYQEDVTPAGEFVFGAPNEFTEIEFLTGTRIQIIDSDGFLASEDPANAGRGGTFGWDFGSISGAPDARVFAVFDSRSMWALNGPGFVEDIHHFLDGTAPVPEPSETGLVAFAAVASGLFWRRLRRS